MKHRFLLETHVEEGLITAILHGLHILELATTTYVFLRLAEHLQATTAQAVITRVPLGVLALVFTPIIQNTRHHTNSGVQVG